VDLKSPKVSGLPPFTRAAKRRQPRPACSRPVPPFMSGAGVDRPDFIQRYQRRANTLPILKRAQMAKSISAPPRLRRAAAPGRIRRIVACCWTRIELALSVPKAVSSIDDQWINGRKTTCTLPELNAQDDGSGLATGGQKAS
jgi:hypothetical protein